MATANPFFRHRAAPAHRRAVPRRRGAARQPQLRHPARDPAPRRDAGGPALSAQPFRRALCAGRRLAGGDRRARARTRHVLALDDIKRLPARTLRVTLECAGNGRARHDAALPEHALGLRGGRHGRMDRHAAAACARARRPARRRGRDRLHRRRPRLRPRPRARLRPQPEARDGAQRRRAAGVGHERRAAAAAARLSPAPDRARLVRHGEREVAQPHRGAGQALRRLPAGRHLHVPLRAGRPDARRSRTCA